MKTKRLDAIKVKLKIIKDESIVIREAYEIYIAEFPEYSKDAICTMIADETGKSRATIWTKLSENSTQKRNIITF